MRMTWHLGDTQPMRTGATADASRDGPTDPWAAKCRRKPLGPAATDRTAGHPQRLVIDRGILGPARWSDRLLEQHAGATRETCRGNFGADPSFQTTQQACDIGGGIARHLAFRGGDGLVARRRSTNTACQPRLPAPASQGGWQEVIRNLCQGGAEETTPQRIIGFILFCFRCQGDSSASAHARATSASRWSRYRVVRLRRCR